LKVYKVKSNNVENRPSPSARRSHPSPSTSSGLAEEGTKNMKIIFNIEKIEEKQVVLKDVDGRFISWPLDLLPPNAKTGDKINFNVGEEENSAKNILNEILG
jgi:hypothetical protein